LKRIIYIFALFFITYTGFAQLNPDDYKAHWIFNIAQKVTWPNEDNIDTFRIAVYGRSTSITTYLKKLAQTQNIKGKPVKVISYSRLTQIPFHPDQYPLYRRQQKRNFAFNLLNQ